MKETMVRFSLAFVWETVMVIGMAYSGLSILIGNGMSIEDIVLAILDACTWLGVMLIVANVILGNKNREQEG